jgi:hypothetical protein
LITARQGKNKMEYTYEFIEDNQVEIRNEDNELIDIIYLDSLIENWIEENKANLDKQGKLAE